MAHQGVVLAFDEWNQRGGRLGHHLEPVLYDTDCTFEAANETAQQAIHDGFEFLIGPICSEAAIAAALSAEAAGALMISPTATHPLVTVNHQGQLRPTVFRSSYAHDWQGQATALFARATLNVDQVAVLFRPGDDYSETLAEAFTHQFLTEGGQIAYQGHYFSNNEDFSETLRMVDQSGAELIYLPGSPVIGNQVGQRLKMLGLNKIKLLGSDSWESAQLDRTLVEGSFFPIHYSSTMDQATVQRWKEAFKSIHSVEPNTLAALSYDAANLLAGTIAQANTLEPLAIAGALEQATVEAVTGPISFDAKHNPIKPVPIVQIRNGQIAYLTTVMP
jgi:branched-chain amino acid transport system substrate-binding protein